MSQAASFTLQTSDDGTATLAFTGRLTVDQVGGLDRALAHEASRIARIDLASVTVIDTAGAWLVWRVSRDLGAPITGAGAEARRLIAAVRAPRAADIVAPPRLPAWQRAASVVGETVLALGAGSVEMLGFAGALILAIGAILRHPSRLRTTALSRQIELVGIDALPIVGLMSFLIGITIAQQGAVQLAQFGAQIYTINLTGRLSLRELGVLMTAIMVAGRSGSAFATEIGTMQLTEEVDAMRTIGVAPMEALVVPRVLAGVLTMPVLGLYAAVLAVIGGASISALVLDIPFMTFLTRIREVVPMRDIWVGVIKAPVFGFIIALTGCYQGMKAGGTSADVGFRTTRAVVEAIFMVIVLDAFFAVFFSEIGWA